MSWTVILSRAAVKDTKKIKSAGLKAQAERLLAILKDDPFAEYPTDEKLVGNLQGFYSRRSSIQHRLIYSVDEQRKIVHVLRMWSHYE